MATDSRLYPAYALGLLLAAGMGTAAIAQTGSVSARVGMIDARQPQAASLATGDLPQAARARHFFRLTSPMSETPECCMAPGEPTPTDILRYGANGAVPATARAAHFTPPVTDGFIGLQLADKARVKPLGAQRLLVWWPDRPEMIRVDHCFSSEGMHVRLSEQTTPDRWQQTRHYYVGLGMDVEADCPASADLNH